MGVSALRAERRRPCLLPAGTRHTRRGVPADRQQQRPQEPQRTTTVAAEDDSGPPSRINSQHSPGVLGEERLAAGRQCQPLGSIPRHSHRSKETALHRNLVNQVRALTRKQTEVSVARVSGEAEVASVKARGDAEAGLAGQQASLAIAKAKEGQLLAVALSVELVSLGLAVASSMSKLGIDRTRSLTAMVRAGLPVPGPP